MPNIDKDIGTKLIALTHQHDQSIIAHEKMLQELTNKLTGLTVFLGVIDGRVDKVSSKNSDNFTEITRISNDLLQVATSIQSLTESQNTILKALGLTKE